MLVQQILSNKGSDTVVTIPPDTTLTLAVEVLGEHRIGAVIVSEDGTRPLGILSERDIVRELARKGQTVLQHRAEEVMTKDLVSCGRNDTADAVLTLMTNGRFRHLPVMDGDEMVGFISIGDVVKARLSELSLEKDALEGMIKGF